MPVRPSSGRADLDVRPSSPALARDLPMHEIFEASEWWEALTLAERAALTDVAVPPPSGEAAERAARRAIRWRREADLLDPLLFAERLALDGLEERAVPAPPRRARRQPAPTGEGPAPRLAGPPGSDLLPARPLPARQDRGPRRAGAAAPAHRRRPRPAAERVLANLPRRTPGLMAPDTIAARLLDSLRPAPRAGRASGPSPLELQVSLFEGQARRGTLRKRASRASSRCYASPPDALEILRRYPVLARDACRHAGQWVETSLEMIARFIADLEEILRRLCTGSGSRSL